MRRVATILIGLLLGAAGAQLGYWVLNPPGDVADASHKATANAAFEATSLVDVARLPVPREFPVAIEAWGDLEDCITDDRWLTMAVQRLIPQWRSTKLQKVLHAVRFWGMEIRFDDGRYPHRYGYTWSTPSGSDLAGMFLSHSKLQEATFPRVQPVLLKGDYGIRVRHEAYAMAAEGQLAHVDSLLRAFAELQLPTTTVLELYDGTSATVADIVTESMANVDYDQELEWTIESLARYVATGDDWVNRFGETFSISLLVDRLCEQPMGEGSCLGTHAPYALMAAWRVDQQIQILTPESRTRVERYFHDVSKRLELIQNPDGSFPWRWADVIPGEVPVGPTHLLGTEPNRLLTSTGHHLEWIALAPPELRPPQNTIRRAANWTLRITAHTEISAQSATYLPATHAVKALCMLANTSPAEVLRASELSLTASTAEQ